MKFGAPENINQLDDLDLSLPPDHPSNHQFLNGKRKDVKVFVGCSVWGQDPWVGDVYPEGTKKKDYLQVAVRCL